LDWGQALRSAAAAGITAERFWRMTLAEIEIEIEARKKQEEMLDFRAGLICATLANMFRDGKQKTNPFRPQDFMIDREAGRQLKPAQQSWQEMKAELKSIIKQHNEGRR
jgi:hypothetical protein